MWTRFFEKEISARLESVDLTDIRVRVEGLCAALEKAGILATVSDEGRARDVLDLAKDITGLVYLGFADSVVYASALLITHKAHVGKIRGLSAEVWRPIRRPVPLSGQFRGLVTAQQGVFQDEGRTG